MLRAFVKNLIGKDTAVQFVKFSTVGLTNTGLDFVIYLALTRLTDFWAGHLVAASAVGFIAAVFSSFFFNTFWTFKKADYGWHKRVVPFFLVAFGGLLLSSLTIWIIITLGVWDIIAKIIATAVALAWNFTMQRKWTFKLK